MCVVIAEGGLFGVGSMRLLCAACDSRLSSSFDWLDSLVGYVVKVLEIVQTSRARTGIGGLL